MHQEGGGSEAWRKQEVILDRVSRALLDKSIAQVVEILRQPDENTADEEEVR